MYIAFLNHPMSGLKGEGFFEEVGGEDEGEGSEGKAEQVGSLQTGGLERLFQRPDRKTKDTGH